MTDIPEAYLAKAEAALHGMAFYSRPEYSSALVRVASALMEAEEEGKREEREACVMITRLIWSAGPFRFSVPDVWRDKQSPSEVYDTAVQDVSAWIEAAIRDRGGKNE